MSKQTKYVLPDGIEIGELVGYHDEGLRYGYVRGVDKDGVKIEPIGPKGVVKNCIHVKQESVRKV